MGENPLKETRILQLSVYVVCSDINCDVFNTAHMLSLQSSTDFLLDILASNLSGGKM